MFRSNQLNGRDTLLVEGEKQRVIIAGRKVGGMETVVHSSNFKRLVLGTEPNRIPHLLRKPKVAVVPPGRGKEWM